MNDSMKMKNKQITDTHHHSVLASIGVSTNSHAVLELSYMLFGLHGCFLHVWLCMNVDGVIKGFNLGLAFASLFHEHMYLVDMNRRSACLQRYVVSFSLSLVSWLNVTALARLCTSRWEQS
ncbi:hypothetical protein BDW75DRAFT_8998 [Aspergillus navahoensis]